MFSMFTKRPTLNKYCLLLTHPKHDEFVEEFGRRTEEVEEEDIVKERRVCRSLNPRLFTLVVATDVRDRTDVGPGQLARLNDLDTDLRTVNTQ